MKTFRLTVVTPDGIFFQGTVSSLMAPGSVGRFTVLADHAPILSTLTSGALAITGTDEITEYQIGPGFLSVLNNQAILAATSIDNLAQR